MLRRTAFRPWRWMTRRLVVSSTLVASLSFGLQSQADLAWAGVTEQATSQTIYHVNDLRRRNGRRPLRADGALMRAAGEYAEALIASGILSHTGADGSAFWERAARAGYAGKPCGENLGENYPGGEAMVDGWLHSPGHREILLMPKAQEIGVGHARGTDGRSVWVMIVGC